MEKLKAVLNSISSTSASKCMIFELGSDDRWVKVIEGTDLEVFTYCLKSGLLQRDVCRFESMILRSRRSETEHFIYLNPSNDQKTVLLNKLEGEIDYLKSLIAQLRHTLEEV